MFKGKWNVSKKEVVAWCPIIIATLMFEKERNNFGVLGNFVVRRLASRSRELRRAEPQANRKLRTE